MRKKLKVKLSAQEQQPSVGDTWKEGAQMQTERKAFLTDEAVEEEIARLQNSPYVKLARKEERIRNKRRQYMYALRRYEKKGKQLQADGVTMAMLESLGDAVDLECLHREEEQDVDVADGVGSY
jgi:hypothetical protein